MSEEREKNVKSRMEIYSIYDYLTTAPTGAVIVYRMEYVDTHGREKDVYIAVLDDGDVEMPWGVGVDAVDALRSADREYSYWYSQSPERKHNPFHEILVRSKCT